MSLSFRYQLHNLNMQNKKQSDLKKRNEELKIQLAAKSRDSRIEAGLEKVRVVVMKMKQPADMLKVCKSISLQLQSLGVKEIRNVQTAIFYERKGAYMNYEYYAKLKKTFITETLYTNHKIAKAFASKMLKGKGEMYITHIKGKKVKEWLAYHKTTNVFIDQYLNTATSLNYYWHSLGPVALGISTYSPLSEEELGLFQRFLKVFELANRRYLDIEKANAQARESQIEAALERVRSRSMAMHDSSEIGKVIVSVYTELTKLDARLDRCFFMIVNPENLGINWWMAGEEGLLDENGFFVQYNEHPSHLMYLDHWKKRRKKWQYLFEGKEKRDWDRFGFTKTELARLPEPVKKFMAGAKKVYLSGSSDAFGLMVTGSFEPLSEEHQDIISRFATVFNQTYTRFNDLKKAEAQSKEAKIELGLERVRARAMAMQHSDELAELVDTVFRELNELDFSLASCIIWIHDPSHKSNALWIASDEMNKPARPLQIVPFYPPFFNSIITAWKTKDPKWIFSLSGTEKKKFQTLFFKQYPELPEALRKPVSEHKQITFSASFNNFGALEIVATEPLSDEKFEILHRFGNVFNTSYTRFNDLQRAEAQAREAQIEAALERVRSRSMAMHKSEELKDVIKVIYDQLIHLNFKSDNIGFFVDPHESNDYNSWDASTDLPTKMHTPYFDHPINIDYIHHRDNGPELFTKSYSFEIKNSWWHELFKHITGVSEEVKLELLKTRLNSPGLVISRVFMKNIGLYALNFSGTLYSDADNVILLRFGRAFEQGYTRFNDLKQAEAQAREAQIEVALERVRSRSMAMHKSEEFPEVIQVVFEQFRQLNFKVDSAQFDVSFRETDDLNLWTAVPGRPYPTRQHIPFTENAVFNSIKKAKEAGLDFVSNQFTVEEKTEFFEYFFKHATNIPEERRKFILSSPGFFRSVVILDKVSLGIQNYSGVPYTDAEHAILKRFAKAFEQTYTRFLDLQKAEAQAREAQIEAALEKVRSRSLQMHNSNELKEVIAVVFDKLKELDFNMDSRAAIINIYTEGSKEFTEWIADPSQTYPTSFVIPDLPFDNLAHVWKAREKGADFTSRIIYKEEKNPFFDYLFVHTGYKYLPEEIKKIMLETEYYTYSIALGKNSGISMPDLSGKQMTESEVDILKRFAKVFDQAYTRFLDLQKAEAQAREAQIETVLEKIRSRSLAMQKPEELTEVAELLRREMGQLGVEELETSSIYIVKIENAQAECWYAIKDVREENTKLVSDEMTLQLNETWVGKQMVQFYQSNDGQISITMKGDQRKEWINYCAEKSNVLQGYYGDEIPERFYHLVKFNGGYIGAASPGAISAESWDLLRRAASVFSLAYTRFNDLQIAEAHARQAEQDLIAIKEAKQKAEAALDELQATQKQLIQSEKMASLGELTAGIAHEIQNPLNFVNNFSEVSKELLDEMKEAIEKGDTEVAKDIMNDVIQNLEKIHHHGKRADGIVKGMLQHSRVSSGQKELTDINGLCDEYLRLAFHGLKAKEKSFHAAMKTSLDESIPPISVIPQDLGRVLLNLMTNAFYTVNEKSKQGIPGYEPTVLISTKKEDHNVLISVKDNGQGISTTIRDKIFQPFFTTKPTGQGTGLGLSLAYDIIKAHGGDLWVETEEGKGSEFMVELPVE